MGVIKRIFVEKKPGFDVEASGMYADLKENLNLENLSGVRLINRYDVEGISDNDFAACKNTIFSEPPVDFIYENDFPQNDNSFIFAVKYLPGQYDQRADSAAQCIQIVTGSEKPDVECAKVYICLGELTEADKTVIKGYCINPVDSMEASLAMPETLKLDMPYPEDIQSYDGFILKTDDEILSMRQELGLAMSGNDLLFCRDYFRDAEKRDPSVTEIRVIDTYWSDHCRHTTFLTSIKNIAFDDGCYKELFEKTYQLYLDERNLVYLDRKKDICLMDIAVMGMKALKKKGFLNDLDESEEINACSINVTVDVDGKDEEWLVMFKNETHNHPTEIEPFGGAATCLGGAIRDPLSGRSYVYQAMRVTGSGDPRTSVKDTLAGKLPQRKISQGAAHGYSAYGNQIGLATGLVTEIYDEGYVAKRMEIGAVVGAAKKENVVRERPVPGDLVILAGGRTGRDGCGGATGSSKEHTEDSILNCGAEVQKGNAPTERKLQRLFRNPDLSRLIKRCNDFGAGGVSVAIGELADSLEIDLDLVPKKYEGLDGTELAISESQERMAVVVDQKDAEQFIRFAMEENLEAVVVAFVRDDGRLKMKWRGKNIVDISRDFLNTNGARQTTNVAVAIPSRRETQTKNIADIKAAWFGNLQQLNVAAQKGLAERFDASIGRSSVLMPFGGKNQLTPAEAMAAKIPVKNSRTETVTIMSFGYNPEVSKWSPYHGALYAVVESVSKVVAAGGAYEKIRLTFQEYFERMSENPYKWGKPFISLLGAFHAQMALKIPSIGGKDSMSGTFKDLDVPPTLVSFAIGTGKAGDIISPEFKAVGNHIVQLNTEYDELDLPNFAELIRNYELIHLLIREKKIISAHTIGFGGVAAAVSKMAFGNDIGAAFTVDTDALFGESYGSFVLEIGSDENVPVLFKDMNYQILGMTTEKKCIAVNGTEIPIAECLQAWLSPLEKVFPTGLLKEAKREDINVAPYVAKSVAAAKSKVAKPRVFIPVFPGTNCEYDTAARFELAGAEAETFVIRNLDMNMLKESIDIMARAIRQSQMIAIPGGFSAGDEPEGSGKFIAAVFRNPYIKEAVMELMNRRDGLMIGICNGFQALIKLGLVPYGEIRDMDESSPTLTFNQIGRHISCLANTKITSNLSPWFAEVSVGDVHTVAVSHGEGRFAASAEVIEELVKNGQVATQYVDFGGNATNHIQFNPNGSMLAIEGITSPDGRILGKMGHSERIGGIYKNVPGDKDQKIFESGVRYFG